MKKEHDMRLDRNLAEETARANAYRFYSLFNNMPSGVAIYEVLNDGASGKDYIVKDFNQSALKIENRTADEVKGRSLSDLRPNIDDYGLIAIFQKVWQTGEPAYFPAKVYIDEEYFNWYENRVVKLPSGEIVAIYDDVTDKMLIAKELEESEEKHRLLITQMTQGLAVHEVILDEAGSVIDYRFIDANQAFERLTGLKREEIIGKTVREAMPSTEERWIRKLGDVAMTGKALFFEDYSERLGKCFDVVAYSPKPGQFATLLSDITERKQAEEALSKSEERFRVAQEISPDGFTILHPVRDETGEVVDFIWVYENQAIALLNNTDPQAVIGKSVLEVFPAHRGAAVFEAYVHVANTGETRVLEEVNVGEIVSRPTWLRMVVVSMGEDIAILSQDITARKQMEEANREHEARFRSFIEQAPVAIDVSTLEGFGLYANQKFVQILGLEGVDEHIGRPIHTYFAPQCVEDYKERSRRRMQGLPVPTEYESILARPDGVEFPVHVATTQIHLPSGRVNIAFVTDISERKKTEDELLYLSTHDHLTGMYNRRFFEQALEVLDTHENLPLSVIMCDVNGLKLVNDSFGHTLGDMLLKKAAEAIKQVCREEDVVARIGGDEFVILLPQTAANEAVLVANKIKELASAEIVGNIELSISYGYDTKTNYKQAIVETIANAENHMYRHKLFERSSIRSKTIDLIINSLFEKSNREAAHSNRVGNICQAIASKMNLDNDDVNQMKIAGMIHDIGKIGIDEKILNKTGSLTSDERLDIERHPEIGWRLLGSTNEFSQLAQFVLYHHEKWDGSGYPNGLKGEAIPREARIIAVADAYDAMTSQRSYRPTLSQEEAIQELRRCSGTQFDPEIVDVFVDQVLRDDFDFRQQGE